MARKKQTKIVLSSEVIKNIAIVVITVIVLFLITTAITSFLKTASIFNVRNIIIPAELQSFSLPELTKIKGKNIFSINLLDVETAVRRRHEELAHLRVVKKFPDSIEFFAVKREPMAWVDINGDMMTIDEEGYLVSKEQKDSKPFTVIKGLMKQRMLSGDMLQDKRFRPAVDVIKTFSEDSLLMERARLKTIDVSDQMRLVCVFDVSGEDVVVYLDKDYIAKKSSMLASILVKHQADIHNIRYIDLRMSSPIVSQKKTVRK